MKKMSAGEKSFARHLTNSGKTWIYEPCSLDVGVPCKKLNRNVTYTPDFWCHEDGCYYEVSCTRQAYSNSMKKISLIRKKDPKLRIMIVHPNGDPYGLISYDRINYISVKDLSLKTGRSVSRTKKIMKVGKVPFKKLRDGRHIYHKKRAIKVAEERIGYYPLDGKRIKALRLKYGVPRSTLAQLLKMSYMNLFSYEKGTIRQTTREIFGQLDILENFIIKNRSSLKCQNKNRPLKSYY
jgi:DNA-binding transcriptional regulator YiaG